MKSESWRGSDIRHLSVNLEWLYADFGHLGSGTTGSYVTITPLESVQAQMFRFGLDYKF